MSHHNIIRTQVELPRPKRSSLTDPQGGFRLLVIANHAAPHQSPLPASSCARLPRQLRK
jgi:hypothetical protein